MNISRCLYPFHSSLCALNSSSIIETFQLESKLHLRVLVYFLCAILDELLFFLILLSIDSYMLDFYLSPSWVSITSYVCVKYYGSSSSSKSVDYLTSPLSYVVVNKPPRAPRPLASLCAVAFVRADSLS